MPQKIDWGFSPHDAEYPTLTLTMYIFTIEVTVLLLATSYACRAVICIYLDVCLQIAKYGVIISELIEEIASHPAHMVFVMWHGTPKLICVTYVFRYCYCLNINNLYV